MSAAVAPARPPAWGVLEQALLARQPIRLRYHGHERVVCPHALGWKDNRPKLLAYQTAGTTSQGTLCEDPRQRWRSMYVDEIEGPEITGGPWESATNASTHSNGIDEIAIAVHTT